MQLSKIDIVPVSMQLRIDTSGGGVAAGKSPHPEGSLAGSTHAHWARFQSLTGIP